MAKQIKFKYKDTEYTLEFNRESVIAMGEKGFDYKQLESNPVRVFDLVAGAFMMHHPDVSEELIEEIYAKIPDKKSFIQRLVEMYIEPISVLFDEPTEGNVDWTQNW